MTKLNDLRDKQREIDSELALLGAKTMLSRGEEEHWDRTLRQRNKVAAELAELEERAAHKDALRGRALNEYPGAVILISHDRHLIDACADRLWIVKDGTVRTYDGDMGDYRTELLSERGTSRKRDNATAKADAKVKRSDQRRDAAERRKELAPLRKVVQAAEKRLEALNADIARLDAALADPALYVRDAAKAQQLSMDRGQQAKALTLAEEAWLAATEAFELAGAASEAGP